MSKARPPEDPDSSNAAYLRALRWLTARELSENHVRTRLLERGYAKDAISLAIERLRRDGTIDDRRAATAIGRTEARVRRHGPRRVVAKLLAMQFDRDLAREVTSELFAEGGEETLLEQTLERRLRGRTDRLRDTSERRKLLAYLIRQGFSASAAASMMRKLSK